SGPSAFAANPAAAIAPTSEPLTPRRTAVPEPVSPAPTNPMVATAVAAPTAETPEPTVAITELTGTSHDWATTCGNEAETPARTNLLTPTAASANSMSGVCGPPRSNTAAAAAMNTPRSRLAHTRTRRRSHRSSRAPANGPITEYGNSSTAKPAAIVTGSV